MYKKIAVFAVSILFIAVATSAVQATVLDVRVDFNDNTLAPANWNLVANPSDTNAIHNLLDFNTGLGAGVTLQVITPFINSGVNATDVFGWSNPAAPWVVNTVLKDYGVLTSGTGQVTLGGLDSSLTYQVELLSVRSATSSSVFTVNGTYDDTGDSATWDARQDGFTDERVMLWSNIAPNGSGQFIIDASINPNGSYAFLNGMRVSRVPEPSGLVIGLGLLVGGLGMLRLPRQRRLRTGGEAG